MYQMNMTQVAFTFNISYEAFRKYVDAIRKRYPNFASGGMMCVKEIGYIAIFLETFKTTKERNKRVAALNALESAVENEYDMKPFIR